jgi:hypothetical protein
MIETKQNIDNINLLSDAINTHLGCPICHLIRHFEFNFLAKYQYDIIKNKLVRNENMKGWGLCNNHFSKFRKISNYKAILLYLKNMGDKNNDFFSNNSECILCAFVKKHEDELITAEYQLLINKEYKIAYEKNIGLCVRHLNLFTDKIKDIKISSWLLSVNKKQIFKIYQDIDEMLNAKSFYEIDVEKRKRIEPYIEKLLGHNFIN